MVMLQVGKTEAQIATELESFLGRESAAFATWLWDALAAARQQEERLKEQQPVAPAARAARRTAARAAPCAPQIVLAMAPAYTRTAAAIATS